MDFFVERGVTDLVVEEKHMGSRALLVVARSAEASQARFGVEDGKAGIVYTRTGRPFFRDADLEAAVVARLAKAIDQADLWSSLSTDWLLLDAEIMPWSAKATELLRRQYQPTHAAALASAEALIGAIDAAGAIDGLKTLKDAAEARRDNARRMASTIDGYCWAAESIEDYRIAPFHLLASEGTVHSDKPHVWHMETLTALAAHDPILHTTGWRRIDATDERQRAEVVDWWLEHTNAGGEGLVVKPGSFSAHRRERFRAAGDESAWPRLSADHLRPGLRSSRQYRTAAPTRPRPQILIGGTGVQARPRRSAPLRRKASRSPRSTQCVLGVLALESEPVDPRL